MAKDSPNNGKETNDYKTIESEFDSFYDGNTASYLTKELIERAEMEVNEKDAWRLRDIEALREIVKGSCHHSNKIFVI
ncbi:hypothetical protein QR98_0058520 [Sarcoptes scabiei]|uniref:Uncharacterized protein n=1 Tax=Sarcoptes scabiei TaxID=52283 RepID=A0A132AA59_SARSC|nr:hypothetical protein QR98_0058520 [Sarcoptes scabiei]